jgi:tetratricopeptide (TPR) repeat protein
MKAARICPIVYLNWAIVLMAAPTAAEAPTNFQEADNAVFKALLNRDLDNWAKTIEKQPPSNNTSELLQRLSVLLRAGHLKSAQSTLDALADAKPAWSKEEWSQIAERLIDREHWDLARHFLTRFPQAEPYNGRDLIAHWDENGSSPDEIDKWIVARSKANFEYWFRERLSYRGGKGTADQLLSSMADEVKAHPHDVKPALAYLKALEAADVPTDANVKWMADVCKPTLSYDSFQLAEEISGRSVPASITLLIRSLQTPFTAEDDTAMRNGGHPQQDPYPGLTPEQHLRIATKQELVRVYEEIGQLEKARPLIAQLAAYEPNGRPPAGFERLAGEAEPASRPRAVEDRILDAEPAEKNSAEYWLARAKYFAGRKELKEATNAYEKAWTLALLDPESTVLRKDNRLYKSGVLREYMHFWKETHDAPAAGELIWSKLKEVPLDSKCASRAIDCLAEINSSQDDEKPSLFRDDDERLWALFKAQKVWDDSLPLGLMIKNAPSTRQESNWKRLEDLAKGADPSRAYRLGCVMGEYKLNHRAISWLRDAMTRQSVPADREKAALRLFEVAIAIDDWQLATQTWPVASRCLVGGEPIHYLDELAVAAARAKAPDAAMKQWAAIANLNRWEMRDLDEMIKAGMRDRLIAFYQQMAHDDPASEVPAEALRKLKAN